MAIIVEQQAMAVMAITDDFRVLPPDDLHLGQVTAAIGLIEHRAHDRGAAGTAHPAFNVAQVDKAVLREIRMQGDIAQATLAAINQVRHAAQGAGFLPELVDDEEIAFFFGDQHAAVRQKRHGPGLIERGDDFDSKRQVSLRLRRSAQKYHQYACQ